MNQLYAVAYSAVATLAKMLGALAAMKGIALILGPEGLGQLGYFINALGMLAILISGGTSLGVTRFVAERRDVPAALDRLLGSVAGVAAVGVVAFSAVGVLAAPRFAAWLLGNATYWPAIVACCGLLPLLAVGSIGLSVVNGFGDTRALVWIQGGAAVLGALGVVLTTRAGGVSGAAFGLAWASSCNALLIALWWRVRPELRAGHWRPALHGPELRALAAYAWIFAFTTVLQNAVQFFLRALVEAQAGIVQTGLWQAVSRLSDAHLQLFFVFCAASVLPGVARARTRRETYVVVESAARMVVAAACLTATAVILLRKPLMLLLYSNDFASGAEFVVPQALGDALRVGAFVPGYYLIARRRVSLLLTGDLLQAGLYAGFAATFVTRGGAEGVCWAYAATYAIYLPLAWYLLWRTSRTEPDGPAGSPLDSDSHPR